MKTLRHRISELMVAAHLVSRDLADEWAAKMDDVELERRLRLYIRNGVADPEELSRYLGSGVECHGSKNRADQRVFYQVFTSRDDDGMSVALNPVPELPKELPNGHSHARFGGKKPGPKSVSGLSPRPRETFRAV